MAAALAVLGLGVVGAAVLTVVGQRRRGSGLLRAAIAGLFFPVAWGVWYLRDERPYGVVHRH